MGEDGLHGEGILDGGDDPEAAATAGAGEGIEVEHGVFDEKTGARVAGATEAEVYAAIGLPWFPPELRENGGEIVVFPAIVPLIVPRLR